MLAAAFLLASVVAPAVAVTDGASATHADRAGPLLQQGVDTDSVRLVVSLHEDGSATWAVQYWTRLDDENTTAAFESLRDDIESDPSNYSDRFESRMQSTVSAAENSTGREMSASNFSVAAETRAPPEYGVVTYSFRWDGFATVDGDAIRAGDAIEGIFLDERTRLVVEWPAGYAASEVTPAPDERRGDALVWRGAETSFVSGEPQLVLRPDAAVGDAGPGSGDGPGDFSPLQYALGTVLVLGVAAAVAWRYRSRVGVGARGDEDAPTVAATGGSSGAPSEADAETDSDSGTDSDEPRTDLLSNEERVVQFVGEQGGRVKQQEIVKAFDWTEARTSQIVRDLRDEGKLEGFRLGRENVLKLPDEDEDTAE